jgi:hypothetical protein
MFLVKQVEEVYSQVPTLLFLHGNAGNIGHRLAHVPGEALRRCTARYPPFSSSTAMPAT